jgi:hypothetical protein
MTSVAVEQRLHLRRPDGWALIRAAVLWGFILLVIVTPAVMSAIVLLRD